MTKFVLVALADRHNKDNGQCNPSFARVAKDCNTDKSTVIRHIQLLEKAGLIKALPRAKNGTRLTNQYTFPHLPVSEGESEFLEDVKEPSPRKSPAKTYDQWLDSERSKRGPRRI